MIRAHRVVALVAIVLPFVARAQPPAAAPDDDPALTGTADVEAAVAPAELDYAALGIDPHASTFDDKLNIYGFSDLTYTYLNFTAKLPNNWSAGFEAGAIDIYLSKNLTEKLRAVGEVRYLYLPNGGGTDTAGIDTSVSDPTNFGRPVPWGGLSIERSYVEYDVHHSLTVRAGRFLTPYGIWNIDHGSPTIITPIRPYVIGEAYFPEHQTGIELFGMMPIGDFKLNYHATISNGRGPIEANVDPDSRPAFGARVEVEMPLAGTLKVGVSAYAGRWTQYAGEYTQTPASYDERSYAADVQWDRGYLHVQGELIGNEKRYRDRARPRGTAGFSPDVRQWGGYGLVGYRTQSVWNAMPFAYYEHNEPMDRTLYERLDGVGVGINFRPTSTFVLKTMYAHYAFGSEETALLRGTALDLISTQASWVF